MSMAILIPAHFRQAAGSTRRPRPAAKLRLALIFPFRETAVSYAKVRCVYIEARERVFCELNTPEAIPRI